MFDNKVLIYRLVITALLTGVIGLQREFFGKPAGFRTHILVGLGACLVMLTGIQIHMQYPNTMPDRIAAQVVSGVGFLGAGSIIKEGKNIEGLTTGASVWISGCLGISIGAGLVEEACITLLITLFILEIKTYRQLIFKLNVILKPIPKVDFIEKEENYYYLTIDGTVYSDKESAKKMYFPFSTYEKLISKYSKKDYIDLQAKPKGYTTVYNEKTAVLQVIREIRKKHENKSLYR